MARFRCRLTSYSGGGRPTMMILLKTWSATRRCTPASRAAWAETAFVTLHVGAGTFKPVETDNPAEHPMHLEHYEVPGATASAITETRQRGGRVIAVGTTTVRTLESAWDAEAGVFRPGP